MCPKNWTPLFSVHPSVKATQTEIFGSNKVVGVRSGVRTVALSRTEAAEQQEQEMSPAGTKRRLR